MSNDPWLIPMSRSEDATLRLFCFPHAGSGAVQFRFWAQALAPAIDIVAVQPPGREARAHEAPLTSLDAMLAELTPRIAESIHGPYALFGHSMGARLAYEVARELVGGGHGAPKKLLVSGHGTPGSAPRIKLSTMSEQQLYDHLRKSGETPQALLDEPDFMARILPVLKADAGVTEGVPAREGSQLGCPIRAYVGESDPMWKLEDLQGWAKLTRGDFKAQALPGAHLYLVANAHQRMALINELRTELTA